MNAIEQAKAILNTGTMNPVKPKKTRRKSIQEAIRVLTLSGAMSELRNAPSIKGALRGGDIHVSRSYTPRQVSC